jgi:hypothetical protein
VAPDGEFYHGIYIYKYIHARIRSSQRQHQKYVADAYCLYCFLSSSSYFSPDPESMYEIVVKRKHALDHGNAVMPSHGTDVKMCATDMDVTMANCIVT